MSEIWEKCERKVEGLKKKLGTQHSSNSDLIFQEVVGRVREKGIVAKPIINNQRIKLIEYVLPGRPTSKMMGIMYGIITKEKNVSRLDYKVDKKGNLTDIFVMRKINYSSISMRKKIKFTFCVIEKMQPELSIK
jgi:hypothetical protein